MSNVNDKDPIAAVREACVATLADLRRGVDASTIYLLDVAKAVLAIDERLRALEANVALPKGWLDGVE
jgi:hypothetical protein